jgi:hypothetical protein
MLVHNKDEKAAASRIGTFLKKMEITAETFSVNGTVKKTPDIFFNRQTGEKEDTPVYACVIIISAVTGHWFDFFAGFSKGSCLPFLVYGEETIAAIPSDFSFCFMPLKTEASLKEYLEAKLDTFKKQEAYRKILKARETLLQKGISVTEESLVSSVRENGAAEVPLFFTAGFSPDTKDKTGVSLLNISARKGNREMLRILISCGANVNIRADDRETSPLIDSAIGKHHGLVEDLLEAGADTNIKSKDGQSALIVAAGAGDEKMAEILLKAGANADEPDSLGLSARKYAALFHQQNMVDIFEQYAPEKVV